VVIRWIPRNNENSAWPWVKGTIDGRLNQGATMNRDRGHLTGRESMSSPTDSSAPSGPSKPGTRNGLDLQQEGRA